jgi:hypothetical protein
MFEDSNAQPSRRRRAVAKCKRRPAETAGATGSLAGFLVALAVGDGVAIATSLAGIIPAAWTWWKAGGGLEGFLEKFKDGDGGSAPGADGAIPAPEMA